VDGHRPRRRQHDRPLLAIATVGLLFVQGGNFSPFNASGGSSFGAITAAAALTLWAFIGLESATVPAGDVEDPKRTIPRSTILGTLLTALVYILGTVAVMGVIPAATLAGSNAPFADAAREMLGGWAGDAVAIGAIVSAFGALNGWILLQGQIPMAAARDRLFPAVFARTGRGGAPVFGLIVSSVLVTLLMAMSYTKSLVDQFTFIILLATLTTLVPYAYSAAAQLMLLVSDRARFSGRRLATDAVVALLAFGYSLWAIAGAGYEVVFKGFLLLLAGIPVYVWMRWRATRAPAEAEPLTLEGGAAHPRAAPSTRTRQGVGHALSRPVRAGLPGRRGPHPKETGNHADRGDHGRRWARLPRLQHRLPRRPGDPGGRLHRHPDPRDRRPHLPAGADFPAGRTEGDDAAQRQAGGRGLRGAHRRRQEPDQPPGRPAAAGRGPARGAGPPPHALRRPGADARAAVRLHGRDRRQQPDHRGARGVRGARPPGHGDVRGRRLPCHPGPRPSRGLDLGLISTEAENLHLAIDEEAYQADTMYRDFAAQAAALGDHAAAERFQRLGQDERRNRDEFLTALRMLDPADP